MQSETNVVKSIQLNAEQTRKFLSCFIAEAIQIAKKRKMEQNEFAKKMEYSPQ